MSLIGSPGLAPLGIFTFTEGITLKRCGGGLAATPAAVGTLTTVFTLWPGVAPGGTVTVTCCPSTRVLKF